MDTDDPRLRPVLEQLAANPTWVEDDASEFSTVRALPSLRELCVEVERSGDDPLHVLVDVSGAPWEVAAVAVFDPEIGPRVTYEREDLAGNGELCTSVLLGSAEPFHSNPAEIEVSGGIGDAAQISAIQTALQEVPGRFGIEATGKPAITVRPVEGEPSDLTCYEGVVYLGGPRAKVMVGLAEESGTWQVVSIRLVEQALRNPEPRSRDGC